MTYQEFKKLIEHKDQILRVMKSGKMAGVTRQRIALQEESISQLHINNKQFSAKLLKKELKMSDKTFITKDKYGNDIFWWRNEAFSSDSVYFSFYEGDIIKTYELISFESMNDSNGVVVWANCKNVLNTKAKNEVHIPSLLKIEDVMKMFDFCGFGKNIATTFEVVV